MSVTKKIAIFYLSFGSFAIVWSILFTLLGTQNDILLFYRPVGLFAFTLMSAILAVRAPSGSRERHFALVVAVIAILFRFIPEFTLHFSLMSWQGLYDYDWVSRTQFVPFKANPMVFLTSLLFPFARLGDSWLNIGLFIHAGILACCFRRRKLWIGCLAGGAVLIELLQMIVRIGVCDMDDVIFRLIGLAIGVGIGVLADRKKETVSA